MQIFGMCVIDSNCYQIFSVGFQNYLLSHVTTNNLLKLHFFQCYMTLI